MPPMALGVLLLALAPVRSSATTAGQEDQPPEITLPTEAFAQLAERTLSIPDDQVEAFDWGAAEPWPAWSDHGPTGWGDRSPWDAWIALLREETSTRAPGTDARPGSHARRARLLFLAKDQERHQDAWEHLLAASASPTGTPPPDTGALLALLWPGITPADARPDQVLPPGVLLRPALPPVPVDAPHPGRALIGLEMEHRNLRIGASTVRLRLLVEADGVQADVELLAGPPAELSVLLPVPAHQRIRILYADWEELGTELAPVAVRVEPGAGPFTIWGRFRAEPLRWPGMPVATPPVATSPGAHAPDAPRAAFVVRVASERLEEPLLAQFTRALGLLFDRQAFLLSNRATRPDAFLEPISIHLDSTGKGSRKLVGMLSMVEARFLGADRTR